MLQNQTTFLQFGVKSVTLQENQLFMKKVIKGCYPRYLVNVMRDGKVVDGVYVETARAVIEICKRYKRKKLDTEVFDMRFLDEVSGYNDYLRARAEWYGRAHALWCVQTKRVYRTDVAAAEATGETAYYVKRSYTRGMQTPKGHNFIKLNKDED